MRTLTDALATAIACSGLALSGCKNPVASSALIDAAPTGTTAAAQDAASPVLAHVGDQTITLADFAAALDHLDRFDRLRYRSPERRRALLGEMIDVALLAGEARERGYDRDPATQQELREIRRDAVLKTVRDGAPAPADIPEADVRAYFEAHKADFHEPERRRVSAIVLGTEASAAAALAAVSKATAAQWGEQVRALSIDPQARANVPIDLAGDFGFVSPPGDERGTNPRVPEEVRAAVFEAAHVGDVIGRVVKAQGRYFVVKLASKSDGHDRTFQEAERSVRVKLAQDKLRAREQALVEDLRKQYPIVIDEAALAQVKVPAEGGP